MTDVRHERNVRLTYGLRTTWNINGLTDDLLNTWNILLTYAWHTYTWNIRLTYGRRTNGATCRIRILLLIEFWQHLHEWYQPSVMITPEGHGTETMKPSLRGCLACEPPLHLWAVRPINPHPTQGPAGKHYMLPNVVLMLSRRRRRRANIKTSLDQDLVDMYVSTIKNPLPREPRAGK